MCAGDHPASGSSLIDKITRQITRQMAAEALRAEVDAYVAYFAGERDKHGHRHGGLTGRSARLASALARGQRPERTFDPAHGKSARHRQHPA
jgi:hypothetical protein